MADDDKSINRIADLLERKIALDLHFHGANQNAIARVLRKSKTWVNDLLQGIPRESKK